MEREGFLKDIEAALDDFISLEIKDEHKGEIRIALAKFFDEEVPKYSHDELIQNFSTPEKIISLFSDYLKRINCIACGVCEDEKDDDCKKRF